MRHQTIIKGIRNGRDTVKTSEEGIVEELKKVLLPEVQFGEDKEASCLGEKPE